MALSIRDPMTDHLARELAGMTGETITEAIGKALKERLARLRNQNGLATRKAEVKALSRRFREHFTGPLLTDDDLYDEDGAPRED